MKKLLDKAVPLIHPNIICLVGTYFGGKPNFTTIGDVAVAGLDPALIMISVNSSHACMEHINMQKPFSINLPTKEFLQEVDFAGIYSGLQVDKSELFGTDYIENIPVVRNAPIQLVVEEEERIQINQRIILVCRVQKTFVDTTLFDGENLEMGPLKTILYGLDNAYYTVGEKIGRGYTEGLKVKERV